MTKAGELNAAVEEVLVDESTLAQRVAELGAEISVDYRERDLLLVGVLKGAVFFIADLMRGDGHSVRGRLHGDLELRLGDGFVGRRAHPEGPRPVDRGPERARRRGHRRLGPDALVPRSQLRARRPASLEVCALLTKPARRRTDVPCRYVGFEIPPRFVIGYGLDFAERYRNLPYVGVLRDELAAQAEESVLEASGRPLPSEAARPPATLSCIAQGVTS